MTNAMAITLTVAIWCAVWWLMESVHIAVTALIPISILPLAGVLSAQDVAAACGNPIVLLMLGGALLSKAMEMSGAHRRLAVSLLYISRAKTDRAMVWATLVVCALLSMWISNTATALMMLPVALATIQQTSPTIATPLLLSVAYGCSIGGLATPIGTPPNLLFLQFYQDATGQTISFLGWMAQLLPLSIVLLAFTGWRLTRDMHTNIQIQRPEKQIWSTKEKRIILLFTITAIAWITLDAPLGGWKSWFNLPGASYASVAILAAIALFVVPAGNTNEKLLNWQEAKKIEWGVLLLFAGGIALAKAFSTSGLSEAIAGGLGGIATIPIWLCILAICLVVTFLTEITSNTATATLLLPLLAATALSLNIDPALLMLPAALSASCAFMLPVATPPNAIVFASGQLHVQDMARKGLMLNFAGALAITALVLIFYGGLYA